MARTLLSIYPESTGRYDEMLAAGGKVRPHWQSFFDHLDGASPEQMRHRLAFVQRRIQENGVTYNVYADPKGTDRPWELDPLPLIIPAEEWRQLSAAVAQRATLLNAVLADLYGPQDLLASGLLPPALVYGHSDYLWPCRHVGQPGDTYLHFLAVDLARSPDGRWWAIADRTQAPSGAGYALENRLIVSRVFPDLFRDLKVEHLAGFFRSLQESLAHYAPADGQGEAPLIVLLTPGPYNETYFEHAYLARYLGFPLVEGQDLTVRGETVFLKTLTGLKRVHAILRRQDDAFCDPLELRGDSALGVPGLLQAVRAGRVLVANALGSGVVESGALLGFLPAISERLLGQPLKMPSIATWWCGEGPALEYACKHLERLVIKSAFPGRRIDPLFGADLKAAEREQVRARLQADPAAYVVQELVELSQAPTWSRIHERRLLARPVGLRVYAVATPQGYRVMPGGLARVAGGTSARVISMQRGGASKDVWVLSDEPVSTFSLLKTSIGAKDVVRGGRSLSSRVVESLFWLGRYSERCDHTSRFLRVALARLVEAGGEPSPALQSALAVGEALGLVPPREAVPQAAAAPGAAEPGFLPLAERLTRGVFDDSWATGVAANLRRLQWSATQVRERLSLDHWHAINRLSLELQQTREGRPEPGETLAFLDQSLLAWASLAGFTMDNMTRDQGWRFHVVGRRIERLHFLATAVATFLAMEGPERAQGQGGLEWLLELADSTITYRSRYLSQPELLPVLDLLVLDEDNPHSIAFQAQVVGRYLSRLQRELGQPETAEGEGDLALLLERLRATDLGHFAGDVCADCIGCQACDTLADLLWALAAATRELSDRLAMRYFTHVGDVSHQIVAA